MDIRVDFSGRGIEYTEEEIAAVVDVMRHGKTLTQGEHMRAFEQGFAKYLGIENGTCFTTANATDALELAAQLCQFMPEDEVIVPSHTFTATAYPFVYHGAKMVWADIDPKTRVVTAETIARCLTSHTKAIIVVHLYGYVADMPAIMELAHSHGLLVIEDAAQSIGADLDGKKSGTFGDMAAFSFHSHKNLSTLGEGGMLVVRDTDKAKVVPLIRHNGHCAWSMPQPNNGKDYWLPAMGNVDMPFLKGKPLTVHNFCLGEAQCALGLKLLDRIDTINAQKRERALRFIDALADFPELEFHRVQSSRHNYHLLVAALRTGQRNAFIRKMYYEHGVKCVVQYLPLNQYALYEKFGLSKAECPNADAFFDSQISFPFQHTLTEKECNIMLEATRTVLTELRKERG